MAKHGFCVACPVGGDFNDKDQTCSISDTGDGLPLTCVGPWAEHKHARVRKYVDISRAVRKKFVTGKGGATYIDLFSGPGRARIRGTNQVIDGSCLVAAKEAISGGAAFSEVHVGDANESFVDATSARLKQIGISAHKYTGPAEITVQQLAEKIGSFGLHFAFLDPYDLKSLRFPVVQRLAKFKHMDMLIHVSAQDLQRNLRRYIQSERSPLDSFAPAWRDAVDPMSSDLDVRTKIFGYWLGLIRAEDMQTSQGVEEVTGMKSQHLYWLVFVARHDLALKFWDEIRNVTKQKSFGF
ncbi:MAG: three-Cys-motif partner protein TcmP [Burkholderiales bacterium]